LSRDKYSFQVRVTGVLLQDDKLLLVKQEVNLGRDWSLPGGRLEHGESLETAIKREVWEETGLSVLVKKLLYVCDVLDAKAPLLHMTFLLEKIGGQLTLPTNEFETNPIHDVQMVPVADLAGCGFSAQFIELLKNCFPNPGNYVGSKAAIGLHI
jgi:ADP-ribose pyrophosphatase YjhB (NUDIX family)